ncbi:MAG TPA: fluoride efflux transporter CrcB [Flavobacterium alvei]|nr:fluoride efflux transporter CrcB [Flavobacterium alvei]
MFKGALIVGFGGFLGSITRYLSSQLIHKYFSTNFPLGTLIVNLAGCLIIGIIFGLFEKGSILSSNLRLFLTVGFCGGFTTFSTFANDSINLINDSEVLYLMLYMGISIFAGISFTFIGKEIANYIWSIK